MDNEEKGKDGSNMLRIWKCRTEVPLTGHREGALQGVGSHGGVHRCYTEITSAFALCQRQLPTSLVTSLLQAPLPGRAQGGVP